MKRVIPNKLLIPSTSNNFNVKTMSRMKSTISEETKESKQRDSDTAKPGVLNESGLKKSCTKNLTNESKYFSQKSNLEDLNLLKLQVQNTVTSTCTDQKVKPKTLIQNVNNAKDKKIFKDQNKMIRRFIVPRQITLILQGPTRPRRISKFLLNNKSVFTFEQVLSDMTKYTKPMWGLVRKVYKLDGTLVTTLQEFFNDTKIFFLGPNIQMKKFEFVLDSKECQILKFPSKVSIPKLASQRRPKNISISTMPVIESIFALEEESESESESTLDSKKEVNILDEDDIPEKNSIEKTDVANYDKSLTDWFDIKHILKDGNFSVTRLCTDKINGKKYEIKIINITKIIENEEIPKDQEIQLLKNLCHPNIITIYEDICVRQEILYVIMEHAEGGNLMQAISFERKFTEEESGCIIRDVARALDYLHSINIVHRNVQPESLLVTIDEDEQYRIKLASFDYAVNIKSSLMTICGNLSYASPEMLGQHGYGSAVDIFSLGVILYELLSGDQPFNRKGLSQVKVYETIINGNLEFDADIWEKVSQQAKKVISLMLTVNPDMRPSADDILSNIWVVTNTTKENNKWNRYFRANDFKFSIFNEMGLLKHAIPYGGFFKHTSH